jgi:hypothetical protein
MKKKPAIGLFLLSFILFCGCNLSVNRSIDLRDGERSGGLNSVNGSIHVGSRCQVDGSCRTVNGRIDVGDDSRVHGLDTVNGRISLAARVEVDGHVKTVNGSIACGRGSKISGDVSTVNGSVELVNSEVAEDVSTVNGDIQLLDKSLVRGDIIIKGHHGHSFAQHLEIRISQGSRVDGDIVVHDPDVEVKVFLSKDAVVKGAIKNAKVIKE